MPLARLWRALLPCPGCGVRFRGPTGVCAPCAARWLRGPPLATGDVVALGRYRGGLGRLARAAKYRPDGALLDHLGALLGRAACARWRAAAGGPVVVVPVPGDPARSRRRGVDHAARLAVAAAAAWGPDAALRPSLRRVRRTRPQAGLADAERRRNLEGAVAWHGPPLAGAPVLLVDDVLTTGATARACRAALAAAGAGPVWLAVVARARG